MPELINLPTHNDSRGDLTVIDKCLPFDVQRIYYIYNSTIQRGGHRHKATTQALICVSGSVDIYVHDGESEQTITLSSPSQCLIVNPQDWHTMQNKSTATVLLVLASHHYNQEDYVDEPYY